MICIVVGIYFLKKFYKGSNGDNVEEVLPMVDRNQRLSQQREIMWRALGMENVKLRRFEKDELIFGKYLGITVQKAEIQYHDYTYFQIYF